MPRASFLMLDGPGGTGCDVPVYGCWNSRDVESSHSHPSWAQIFASGSCFQIPLACVPLLM